MTGTLLQQVRVIAPATQTDQIADVWIEAGRFRAIAPHLDRPDSEVEIIDGTGKILAPGLVDLYSHSSEPGNEPRETLADLLAGASAGGVTRLGILPNTDPPLDQPAAIRHLLSLAAASGVNPRPTLLPWAALTLGAQGEHMTELAAIAGTADLALAGFADGQPLSNPVLLRRLLEYAHPLQRPIALWPCDRALAGNGIAREGSLAQMGGLPGTLVAAETAALTTVLELVREIGTPVHLMRLSTARSVELVQAAQASGLPVTASTTWMHLLFSTADALSYDPNLRLEPPLGNPADQAALIAGVKFGVLSAIAIDHSPYTYEEKTVAFGDAPPGAMGLELALPVLWQRFVTTHDWTPLELLQAMSCGPAHCLGMPPPTIAVDQPAEAFLFDPAQTWRAETATLRSPARNTPFLNQSLQGKVIRVVQ